MLAQLTKLGLVWFKYISFMHQQTWASDEGEGWNLDPPGFWRF